MIQIGTGDCQPQIRISAGGYVVPEGWRGGVFVAFFPAPAPCRACAAATTI
jgi:hypothetical protein